MKKRLALMVALVAIIMVMPLWQGGEQAAAAEINVLPYYVAGNVGDSWTYTYVTPSGTPDFIVTLTRVTSGSFAGKFRLGDYVSPGGSTDWQIFDSDTNGINVYATGSAGIFNPPGQIGLLQPLNEMIVTPLPIPDNYWYFQQLASLTVPAGTFNDILVNIALDSNFGPNGANTSFGLDPVEVPYGVTHVEWMAAGIGVIQNVDIDAESGNLVYEFQLKATSVPLPTSLVMLGSGLLGLIGWRKFSIS